jgi:hypothetical protein
LNYLNDQLKNTLYNQKLEDDPSKSNLKDGHIRPILLWAHSFAVYTSKVLMQQQIQKDIDACNDEIEENRLRADRIAQLSQDIRELNVIDKFRQSLEIAVKNRPHFVKMARTDQE